jgi:hypothetical protein
MSEDHGTLSLDGDTVRYSLGSEEAWSFSMSELHLIGEHTNKSGPGGIDYFYVFIAGMPAQFFEAPMYADPEFIQTVAARIGSPLTPGLAYSTDFASRIIWPQELAERPLFLYTPASRGSGIVNRLRDRTLPLVASDLTGEVKEYLLNRRAG